MTIEEAIKLLEKRPMAFPYSMRGKCNEALDMAISALRTQQDVVSDEHMTPCSLCMYNPPSSSDGKPCAMCPATRR